MTTELAIAEPPKAGKALADLRSASLSVPVEVMQQALAEYRERRDFFREWLKAQLIAGVHYGVPPGCEPRESPRREQWQHKPSLYKAGADFICDLMQVEPRWEVDMDAWKQLGEPIGAFVMKCRLLSKSNGEVVGEGRGVHKDGQKKMDANGAIKMAEKKAKVDAVLNAYGLSDLFTQDLEDAEETRERKGNRERVTKTESAIAEAKNEERLTQLAHWMTNAKPPFEAEECEHLSQLMEDRRTELRNKGART